MYSTICLQLRMWLSRWANWKKKNDVHNDLYQAKDSNDESKVSYICVSYQPYILFEICQNTGWVQAMFEETQKCSNSSLWSDPAIQAKPHIRSFTSTHSNSSSDEPEAKFELPMIPKIKAGISTKGSLQLLEGQRPQPTKLGDAMLLEKISQSPCNQMHTVFQSVLHVITFSNLKTTDNSLKVVLTEPNIMNGVRIPNWKEITFSLPLHLPTATNNICHFTVHIMGNKVDYGELPQFIFQPNIFKTAQQMILKTTEDLRVCPGINDPTMINTAERKNTSPYTKLTLKGQLLMEK